MAWVDLAIIILIALSVLGGLEQGFFRSVFSLGGLLMGVALAAWNYARAAALFEPLVHSEPIADVIGFLLIALVVMVVAGVVGAIVAKAVHQIGLGCLDKLAGALFGFAQGLVLVTLGILVVVAFFPQARLLADARLPRLFFGACHLSTHMTPDELARRVREGLRKLEEETPEWMHPPAGKS
jgi:membrane protein required for colicin V production